MIGKGIYFVAGAALGGYLVHKLNRTARSWGPSGVADRVGDRVLEYRSAIRELNDDIAGAVEEREAELLRRYGAEDTAAVEPRRHRGVLPGA
ncbi:DUF6167 family protein [Nocardiopsis ansamitocini]|uniref:Secreted protein n=1 Tax=Nocardiopsis ansamitocini TaxID=1670832 RepID=A0A9W6P6U8_9ACTN|nr:DUF6167 family protein [Nocardiopsis ansamitocini]GLU48118.1 hypothetical protein Nans01_24690 [Nocardiopsis ansamitocini]